MSKLDEQELKLLENAISKSEDIKNRYKLDDNLKKIITIVEDFLKKKQLICYGGTAINNILSKDLQFYDRSKEIPDYDFYSTNALKDAKELANLYFKKGYTEVRAAAGIHYGTFKVFVNFIPIADITSLDARLFNNIKKDSIKRKNILYAPPNLLRMSMYLELSRPSGDTSRWEKVFTRLKLLNKQYPLEKKHTPVLFNSKNNALFNKAKHFFIKEKVVFFGSFALNIYSKQNTNVNQTNGFYILSNKPKELVLKFLKVFDKENVEIRKKDKVDDILSSSYEIYINNIKIATVFKTLACYSYVKFKNIFVASIDTMLSFYLLFYYLDFLDYNKNDVLNIANYLFTKQNNKKNKTKSKGLFKRFPVNCYGKQLSLEEIRAEKSNQFEKLKTKRNTKEYEEWFLNYNPDRKLEELKDEIDLDKDGTLSKAELDNAIKIFRKFNVKNKTLKKSKKKELDKFFTLSKSINNVSKSIKNNSWILPR